jgi:hypothetical protein
MRKLGITFLEPIPSYSNVSESQKESIEPTVKLPNRRGHYLEDALMSPPEKIPAVSVWNKRLGAGLIAKLMPILSNFRPV